MDKKMKKIIVEAFEDKSFKYKMSVFNKDDIEVAAFLLVDAVDVRERLEEELTKEALIDRCDKVLVDREDGHEYRMSPYERTRAAVYATGNRWAIENFNATHS